MNLPAHIDPPLSARQRLVIKPFDPRSAPDVVSWVRSPHELWWLAPKTIPPLTPAKVVEWTRGRASAAILLSREHLRSIVPCGYAELSRSAGQSQTFWLGHVVIDPQCRGRGLGARFVRLLMVRAFQTLDAKKISLIVFPDNDVAARSYARCGFVLTGQEWHRFRPRQPKQCMNRFDVDRSSWRNARSASEQTAASLVS